MPRFRSFIKRAVRRVSHQPRQLNEFDNSGDYWEERYRSGGDSGAGSYSRLAHFKADFLNEFVVANEIKSVIEFGSGDGAQLELANYPTYIGVDVSWTAIASIRRRFSGDATKKFFHTSEANGLQAQLLYPWMSSTTSSRTTYSTHTCAYCFKPAPDS